MKRELGVTTACLTLLIVFLGGRGSSAQSAENVLVVANATSPLSNEIADYYVQKRQIPSEQVLRLKLPLTEEIQRPLFELEIERPIAQWLTAHSAEDRILYLVLTKDVPIRIAGTVGMNGTAASVDSELTLLYRRLVGGPVAVAGSIANPYFLGDATVGDARAFTHEKQDLYLVARLDGYTVADVKGLIDRGIAPSQQGNILLDEKSEWIKTPGNTWLADASARLKKLPGWENRIELETGSKVLREEPNVFGYYSWGSNDPAIIFRHLHLEFVPGAIAGEFVSTDARTFQEPPADWQVRDKPFKGTPQSLIGDLIRDGITGVAGHVAEPYLNATIRPDILFPAYVSGFNLVESFYLAMPYVSWQTVVVGDPLCAPFREKPLSSTAIDHGVDPITEVPAFLSERRVGALVAAGARPQAAKLYLRSQIRLAKQDRAGAQKALEDATAADEGLAIAQLALAQIYEASSQWDASIDRYRRVLVKAPKQPIALNNLAYALAERKHNPTEALPLAKEAYAASNGAPTIADTLGWVLHLLGNDAEAEPYVTKAVAGNPPSADLHLHAAIVFAALDKLNIAGRELDRAAALDKAIEQRDDVKQLRKRL